MMLDGAGVLPPVLEGSISVRDDVHTTDVQLTGGSMLTINPVQGGPVDRGLAPGVALYSNTGELLSATNDGHAIQIVAPTTGVYQLRVSSENERQVFLGDYMVTLNETPFAGTVESEPNDVVSDAMQLRTSAEFGGSLSGPADLDYFRFTASAGQVVALKLNPAVRLFDSARQLVGSGLDGNGLAARLPVAGDFTFAIAADNDGGPVAGEYFGSLIVGDNGVLEDDSATIPERAARMEDRTLHVVPSELLKTSSGEAGGLTGSYVNGWLGWVTSEADWRQTQTITGTRVDAAVNFRTIDWGERSPLGITSGPSDDDWDLFSVQWDGWITIPRESTRLYTRSDDSSRMWIDINGDGRFDSADGELVDNHWGTGQAATTGRASPPMAAGEYRIRLQYAEQFGENSMQRLWDDGDHSAEPASGGPVSAAGILSGMGDVDLFAIELTAGQNYEFQLKSSSTGLSRQDCEIGL